MKQTEAINIFYAISGVIDDDVEALAFMLQLIRGRPKQIFNDLENLNLLKYENELQCMFDLKTQTLKDLRQMYLKLKEKDEHLDTKTGKVLPRISKHNEQNRGIQTLL